MKSLNIRKKLVTLAVASAVSGGAMMAMTAPVHAMNVSQNNTGEVLLFPYYTVKNGYDTVFTVTNTSDKTAVFKIRFRSSPVSGKRGGRMSGQFDFGNDVDFSRFRVSHDLTDLLLRIKTFNRNAVAFKNGRISSFV